MASLNKVYLIGRIAYEPKMQTTKSNLQFCKTVIKCLRTVKRKNSTQEEKENIPVTAFGKKAEELKNCYNQNRMVHIEGRLHLNQYVNHSGETVSNVEIIVENVFFDEESGYAAASNDMAPNDRIGQPIPVDEEDVPF